MEFLAVTRKAPPGAEPDRLDGLLSKPGAHTSNMVWTGSMDGLRIHSHE